MNKEFIRQRIETFAGIEVDPSEDNQVVEMLKRKFNVRLPQRPTLDEALKACISDHEIIDLITEYRSMA